MKKNTIKWRIFKYNLLIIVMLIALVTVIFNAAIRIYFERDITMQLETIISRTEDIALHQGPGFFPPPGEQDKQPSPAGMKMENDIYHFYFMLDQSLREPLSVLNADFLLLSDDMTIIDTELRKFMRRSDNQENEMLLQLNNQFDKQNKPQTQKIFYPQISGSDYIAIIRPVSGKNSFGLGYIVIYSSMQKVNQMQLWINIILFIILLFAALIVVGFSSSVSKKISAPFSSLNQQIRSIAERKFENKILIPVDDELQELVNNINTMSEKLEIYDKAQKTFLQNASHEFRTPLMSIQSYAEGIKYQVVDTDSAIDIIITESKRMAHLVEDLLYLSRLDTIEDNVHFFPLSFAALINACIERVSGIAMSHGISFNVQELPKNVELNGDEEMLSRAIINILSNCIRYASTQITIKANSSDGRIHIFISDDGPGFDKDDLPYIFDRFYKGKKGNSGLGLAICKGILEKHDGSISADDLGSGAVFIIDLPI